MPRSIALCGTSSRIFSLNFARAAVSFYRMERHGAPPVATWESTAKRVVMICPSRSANVRDVFFISVCIAGEIFRASGESSAL
jgi:hypothetical protein